MKIFGLIGYPLGHSFSKILFTKQFEEQGLSDHFFELFPLENILSFSNLIESHPDLQGLAVTIPHKQTVMHYLDEISEEAQKIGAVNCIKIRSGNLKGYNTDVVGFEKSFVPLLQSQHQKALVLGTGGAAKCVEYTLKKHGIQFVNVSRNPAGGDKRISYKDIDGRIMKDYKIIINCTPVGMSPNENDLPQLPYDFLTKDHLLYDLIYKPFTTKFLDQGIAAGCLTKNGHEMFLLQAAENWKIWSGESDE
jgi:shikimate dehydrogenase